MQGLAQRAWGCFVDSSAAMKKVLREAKRGGGERAFILQAAGAEEAPRRGARQGGLDLTDVFVKQNPVQQDPPPQTLD